VDRCTFERNTVTTGAGLDVAGGVPGFVSVTNSLFRDNTATAGGGIAIAAERSADVLVSGCRFEDNHACAGGGLYLLGATVEVVACEFRANHRPSFCGTGAGGGAIRADASTATVDISRSLFLDSDHGLLWGERSSNLTAVLSTFVNANVEDPAIRLAGSTRLELDSCIVWGAADSQVDAGPRAVLSATHSDVRMGGAALPGVGNLDVDPAFVDPAAGDLHLAADSPCVDAGNPALSVAASDLDRDSRLLDGNLDGRVMVDMGADEFAALHLEVLGLPLPGHTLTFVTTGPPGLQAFLLLSAPGLHHLPAVGTLFLDLASPLLRVLPWSSTPSTVSILVPPGVPRGLFHFQELGLGTGVRLLSNYVPLQF
jgi:hypothetical protein